MVALFQISFITIIEDCSGRSTQVPFWRKWVIGGFEVVIDQKIFWQNFGQFGPFQVGVTQGSSGGQIFKMLQVAFHIYQITREVIRITKIYSLLCIGCMVREIFTKGHPKVKWGQIFNNIRFAWMIYQIIRLSLHIPKIYTFKLFFFLAFTFEISPFVWIQTMIVVEEVLKCRMAIIDYKKSIIHITL